MRASGGLRRAVRAAAVAATALVFAGACDEDDCETQHVSVAQANVANEVNLVGAPGTNRLGVRIAPTTALVGIRFGASIALALHDGSLDHLVVGAPGDSTNGVPSGAVYVVLPAGVVSLAAPSRIGAPFSAPAGAEFGAAVASAGDVIVVGAPGVRPAGAAFVYERRSGAWVLVGQISAFDSTPGSGFGTSVAVLSGAEPLVLVGAPDLDHGGQVFVYRKSSSTGYWSSDYQDGHTPALRPADGVAGDRFGASLSAVGTGIVVGAPGVDLVDSGSHALLADAGAVYVYSYSPSNSSWAATASFSEPTPRPVGRFGSSVAYGAQPVFAGDGHVFSRGTIVVGGPGSPGVEEGRAHVFVMKDQKKGWESSFLERGSAGFGTAVAVAVGGGANTDDFTFVGGRPLGDVGAASPSGSVGFWERYSGHDVPIDDLAGATASATDLFGAALAVEYSHSRVFVGAPGDGADGAVYVFNFSSDGPPTNALKRAETTAARRETYLAVRADADSSEPGSAKLAVRRALRPAFRVEVPVGSFDASKRAGLTGASVALELARRGSEPAQVARIAARFTADGIEVSAATESGPVGTTAPLAGAWSAEFAASYDGAVLRLEARPRGAGTFTEVASIPVVDATFMPSIRVDGIGAGAEVGIGEPRVLSNGAPASGAPPAETIVDRLYEAMDRQLESMGALDRGGGNAEARPPLDVAATKLREARTALGALVRASAKKDRAGPKSAQKQVKAALAKVAAARKKTASPKTRNAFDKLVSQLFAAERRAVAALSD